MAKKENCEQLQEEKPLEEMFAELDLLAEKLENRDTSLEDSFILYRQGMELLKLCSGKLDTVEKNMQDRKRKETAASSVQVPSDVLHPKLYDRLVAWRNTEAARLGLPVYTVIQQKAILGISNLVPADKDMLVRIPYFGKKGVEKYGDAILEIVYAYCKEKGLEEPDLML